MNKKQSKFRETRGNGHPSQNNLPPIDKFHPDYWYYREEMDEPDDIDINYENESKNRNKKVIRLTETDLHNVIKSCVRNVLNESDYMDDGNLEGQYYKNPDSMWTYGTNLNPAGVDGLDPHSIRRSGNGNKNADNRASWDYFDAVRDGADMKMRSRLNADANRQPNKWELYDYMYGWNEKKGDYDTPMSMFKDELDKQWQDTKNKEKYSKMADSRPLHRKGSLNRAMEEAIRKTVNKILREEYFNKNVPNDSLFSLNGNYEVYVDGQILNATIDVENEFFEIGEWSLDGKEAIDAITQIYDFYKHSNNTIESAIEQYAYDALR